MPECFWNHAEAGIAQESDGREQLQLISMESIRAAKARILEQVESSGENSENPKKVTFFLRKNRNLPARVKLLMELVHQSGLDVAVEALEEEPFQEFASEQEEEQSESILSLKTYSFFKVPADSKDLQEKKSKTYVSVNNVMKESVIQLKGLYGLPDGVQFEEHILNKDASSQNGKKLRFEKDALVSFNAIFAGFASWIVAYLVSKNLYKGVKGFPRLRYIAANIFAFSWAYFNNRYQRELGSFRLQGAEWQIYPEKNEAVRESNKAFMFTSGFIEEMVLFSTMFYALQFPGGIPLWKTIGLSLISATAFIPIEKIRALIFLEAERLKLEGQTKEAQSMSNKATIAGFLYWQGLVSLSRNVAFFWTKIPFEKFLGGIVNSEKNIKGTGGMVKFWDIPVIGLGLAAIGIELYDEKEHLLQSLKNSLRFNWRDDGPDAFIRIEK